MQISLILVGDKPTATLEWSLGQTYSAAPSTAGVAACLERHSVLDHTDALLFWDPALGQPDPELVTRLLSKRVDVWHAGLKLGMAGQPGLLDFVKTTWQFNRDISPDIEGTSWRLSLRCCLVRTEVIRQLGGLNPALCSLDAAALEFGYRCLVNGAIIRYTPELIKETASQPQVVLDYYDELRFITLSSGRKFCCWAAVRAILAGYVPVFRGLSGLRLALRENLRPALTPFSPTQISVGEMPLLDQDYRVTVLIPTLDRYPYLRTLLTQLRSQTIRPFEILVIDQTEMSRRDYALSDEFSDLPLKLIYQDEAGQCSSRNAGLQLSSGNYILFVDDDDEIQPDLIEKHLRNLLFFNAETSSGSVEEISAVPLDGSSILTAISNVFPAGNTLICREVLTRSGLFDMAFERKQSEDGDLGMRIYLAGALMVYNPQVSVFHHRAPRGGLRAHKARVITYSSSRLKLLHRRLPHVSEVYHMYRYFTKRQVRESAWMTVFGTFSIRGSKFRKLLKIAVSALLLPDTLWKMRQKHIAARALLKTYPQIPALDQSERETEYERT